MDNAAHRPQWEHANLSYEELLKVYHELDENSKILVQTDLELHKTKGEVETRVNQLLLLNKLSDSIHASQEKNTIIKTVCESLVSGIGFEKAWVLYYEKEGSQPLFIQFGASLSERPQLLQISEQGMGLGSQEAGLFSIDQPHHDATVRGLLAAIQCSQLMQVPMRNRKRSIGGIFAARMHHYPPVTEQDLQFLEMLGRQVGIALENAELHGFITASNVALEERVSIRSKELMEANTRLLELDRIKSNFISLVSHELRTPMTAIKGFSALLLEFEERMAPGQRKEVLRKISDESDRLSRLIADLLNISRIESGRIELRWNEINLAKVIEDVFEKERVQNLPVDYRMEIAMNFPRFAADPDKLHQVILNLVANAARFTPPQGVVTVLADGCEEGVRIRVTNPGEGIPFVQLSKIFDKFYRMDNDINKKNAGTGLGLSICRGLVDLHSGKIWADSELNKQTTFTVLLPLNMEQLKENTDAKSSSRAA